MLKHLLLLLSILPILNASPLVKDERSFLNAIKQANKNSNIHIIEFTPYSYITLHQAIVYTGKQNLSLLAYNSTIDAKELMATTRKDATLLFKTTADISITNLCLLNSPSRALVHELPKHSLRGESRTVIKGVTIAYAGLHGLHISDKAHLDKKKGSSGSLFLLVEDSNISFNGLKAHDYDGIRVDEGSYGDIEVRIVNSVINDNGGDGIELDEAGKGDVSLHLDKVEIHRNGFFTQSDFDDGIDIDETGKGDVIVYAKRVTLMNNAQEAVDIDEKKQGDVIVQLKDVMVQSKHENTLSIREKGKGKKKLSLRNYRLNP